MTLIRRIVALSAPLLAAALLLGGCSAGQTVSQGRAEGSSASTVSTPSTTAAVRESATENQDGEPVAAQPLPYGEADMAALLYLGGKEDLDKSREYLRTRLDGGWPQEMESVDSGEGQEIYLLLPRESDTTVGIVALDSDERPVRELLTANRPVLLCCNRSDVIRSVQVTVRRGEKEVTFAPYLSLRGGDDDVVAGEGIYTENIWRAARS